MTSMKRAAALALTLGALAALGMVGAPPLRGWVALLFPVGRYPLLFAIFFVSWLAAERAPDRARPWVLLGGAVLQGLAFDPVLFAAMAGWVLLYHRVLIARIAGPLKLGFLLATVAVLAVLCDAHHWPGRDPIFMRGGYLFATGFFLQALRVLVDLRAAGWRPVPRVDLLVYFLIAPFWIMVPYMLAILPLETVRRGIAARDGATVDRGLRTLAIAAGATALLLAITTFAIDPRAIYVECLRRGDLLAVLPAGLLYYPVFQVALAFCSAGILLGLLRLLGIAAPAFIDRPLAAESVTDWWRRWNIPFRELLVDIFWYPVVFRIRRRPRLAIAIGCASVFLVGSPLLHWPKRYFNAGSPLAAPVGLVAESLVMAVIVAVVLIRERRRRPSSPHPVRVWGRRLATWSIVYLSVAVAGQGTDYLVYAWPLERALPVVARASSLAEVGRIHEAAALLTPDALADLEWSAAIAPRSPQRRADLATARSIVGDPRAAGDLALARRLAASGDNDPALAAMDIDVDAALSRAEHALAKGNQP
jgi:hypothetical protein